MNTSNKYDVSAHLRRLPDRSLDERNVTWFIKRIILLQEREVFELNGLTQDDGRYVTAATGAKRGTMVGMFRMRTR